MTTFLEPSTSINWRDVKMAVIFRGPTFLGTSTSVCVIILSGGTSLNEESVIYKKDYL